MNDTTFLAAGEGKKSQSPAFSRFFFCLLFFAPLGHAALDVVERDHPQSVRKRAAHEAGHHAAEERAAARETAHDLRVRLPGELAALDLRRASGAIIIKNRIIRNSSLETDHQNQDQESIGNEEFRNKIGTV